MKKDIFPKILNDTNNNIISIGILFLRALIGILLFIAGAGKLFGWFGGRGIEATIEGFSKIGISIPLTYMSCYAEFIGGLLLTLGLLTRPAAFVIMINMIVATIIVLPHGFLGPGGAQTAFIFLVIDIVIFMTGPMNYSIDSLIFRN
jgi:putative oxidoreductase